MIKILILDFQILFLLGIGVTGGVGAVISDEVDSLERVDSVDEVVSCDASVVVEVAKINYLKLYC